VKLLRDDHRPDGIDSPMPSYARSEDWQRVVPCVWEYTLPSGKVGTCGTPATWELEYQTGTPQPFTTGNITWTTYRCDLHHLVTS